MTLISLAFVAANLFASVVLYVKMRRIEEVLDAALEDVEHKDPGTEVVSDLNARLESLQRSKFATFRNPNRGQ